MHERVRRRGTSDFGTPRTTFGLEIGKSHLLARPQLQMQQWFGLPPSRVMNGISLFGAKIGARDPIIEKHGVRIELNLPTSPTRAAARHPTI